MSCSCEITIIAHPLSKLQAEDVFNKEGLDPESGLVESSDQWIKYFFENLHASSSGEIREHLKKVGVRCAMTVKYSDIDLENELSILEPMQDGILEVDLTLTPAESAVNFERVCLIQLIEQGMDISKIYEYLKQNSNQSFAQAHNSEISRPAVDMLKMENSKNIYDCEACRKDANAIRSYMILCKDCGNKRCPQALNHRHKCTGSNEVNQIGIEKA